MQAKKEMTVLIGDRESKCVANVEKQITNVVRTRSDW